MAMGTVLGIDYSFTCPAVCAARFDGTVHFYVHYKRDGNPYPTIPGITWSRAAGGNYEVARYIELGNWVLDIVRQERPHVVILEDYAFAAAGRITQLAENGGVLKAKLWEHAMVPMHVVAPTTMKKFATGSGRAQKEDIVTAFIKVYPAAAAWQHLCHPKATKVGSPVADIADAYFLAQYGIHSRTQES